MSALSARSIAGAFIVAAVIAAIGAAFRYAGSPADARQERLDDRRVRDLGEIATSLEMYWRTNTRLPGTLEEAAYGGRRSVPADPESGQRYTYRTIDDRHYELCATFAHASDEVPTMPDPPFRGHGAGRQCFTIEVKSAR